MQGRSTSGGWQRLLRIVVDRGVLGVITLALIVTLACVVSGVSPPVIYALVALVASFTLLIAVAAVFLKRM